MICYGKVRCGRTYVNLEARIGVLVGSKKLSDTLVVEREGEKGGGARKLAFALVVRGKYLFPKLHVQMFLDLI